MPSETCAADEVHADNLDNLDNLDDRKKPQLGLTRERSLKQIKNPGYYAIPAVVTHSD